MGKPPSIPLIPGQRFGLWTVLALAEGKHRRFHCLCDCGKAKSVSPSHLVTGVSSSCGCVRNEKTRQRSTKHGRARRGAVTPEYHTWTGMIQRCVNPKVDRYSQYGGRGISVCERWRSSFISFYQDMGDRPSARHSLDRIDNDGDYCPSNCRWATNTEQGRNRPMARIIVANGISRTLAEWVEVTGLHRRTIADRIDRLGWSADDAMSKPAGRQGQRKRKDGSERARSTPDL